MISSVSWVSSSTAALLVAVNGTSTAARGSHRRGRNLIRVLEATVKGPQRGSQRPTSPRPHTDQGATTSAGDQPDFHPGTGLPAGRSETSLDISRSLPSIRCPVPTTGLRHLRDVGPGLVMRDDDGLHDLVGQGLSADGPEWEQESDAE